MYRRLVALGIMAGTSAVALGQEYDDPAIVACELVARSHYETGANSFERVNANVSGSSVILDFRWQVLNAKPNEQRVTCPFTLGVDGFVFDFSSIALQECEAKLEAYRPIMKRGFETAEQADEIMPQVNACQDLKESAEKEADRMIGPARSALEASGLYPITEAETALR